MSKVYTKKEKLDKGMTLACPQCGEKKLIRKETRESITSATGIVCIACPKCGVEGPPIQCAGYLDLGSMIISFAGAIKGWESSEWRQQFNKEVKS